MSIDIYENIDESTFFYNYEQLRSPVDVKLLIGRALSHLPEHQLWIGCKMMSEAIQRYEACKLRELKPVLRRFRMEIMARRFGCINLV